MLRSTLCVDIGGTRIKYAVLPQNTSLKDANSSILYNLRTLGWLNSSLSNLFSKQHWASVIAQTKNIEYSNIAVGVPGSVSLHQFFERDDLIKRGVPKKLKVALEQSSNLPVDIIKDADAWAIGVLKYLQIKNINISFPILLLAFGTGVGVSIILSSNEFQSIEISRSPCKFINLTNISGNVVDQSWKVHNRIGKRFFDWVEQNRTEWSYDKIRTEFTKRVYAFIMDLGDILPKHIKDFGTIVLGGGNAEFVSQKILKNYIDEYIISLWKRHLDFNPDFIPLIGLSYLQNNIKINKSPW